MHHMWLPIMEIVDLRAKETNVSAIFMTLTLEVHFEVETRHPLCMVSICLSCTRCPKATFALLHFFQIPDFMPKYDGNFENWFVSRKRRPVERKET